MFLFKIIFIINFVKRKKVKKGSHKNFRGTTKQKILEDKLKHFETERSNKTKKFNKI